MLTDFRIANPKYKYIFMLIDRIDAIHSAINDDEWVDSTEYFLIIRSLIYIIVYTCPDITYAIGQLSQFMRDLVKHYIRALHRVMHYLYFIIDYRLCFDPDGQTLLIVYLDTDYTSDKTTERVF